MISNNMRETRKGRGLKMPKNIERLYKEGKCTECSVVVTRMDFAKILGKFTKVKIQYESTASPKAKKNTQKSSPGSNARLKSNENGMVLLHRNAYTQHPVKDLLNSKKGKANEITTPRSLKNVLKENSHVNETTTPRQKNNILKENNRLKKTLLTKKDSNNVFSKNVLNKLYGIIFENPTENRNDMKNKLSLTELLPSINKNILPSEEWCIAYLPNGEEPKEDKVYDRIAAELEDLMYNEKPDKADIIENKVDEFPSIMDILNDSTILNAQKPENQSSSTEVKSNLESSDVEAMLLGKSNVTNKESEVAPMEVENSDVGKLIDDVVQFNTDQDKDTKLQETSVVDAMDNPHSPSILDEALQKGVEELLPCGKSPKKDSSQLNNNEVEKTSIENTITDIVSTKDTEPIHEIANKESRNLAQNVNTITHVVFKKCINGKCYKSVTCPKTLKYSIELEGKPVEFIGAPKFISSLEDLQVLLQIVNESELKSLYVLC